MRNHFIILLSAFVYAISCSDRAKAVSLDQYTNHVDGFALEASEKLDFATSPLPQNQEYYACKAGERTLINKRFILNPDIGTKSILLDPNSVKIIPIPTTWDAIVMPIPTQWDALIFLLSR
jgi:hypothetical protein